MVPRVDIVALDVDQPFSEVVKCMVEHGHSRVPVYRETLDDVIGFIHVKDVLAPVADRRPAKLERLLRKVLFVAPSLPILDLLVQMRQARTHIAMVVDEFGGIDGLVTIEDLIEEIVGEIEDEHDVPETPTLIERPDGSIIADARIPIEAVEEQHGIELAAGGRGGDGRYARRAGLHAGRAGAEARRGHRASRRHRIRGARCRSAPRQAAAACAACRPAAGGERGGQCLTARLLRRRPGARVETPLCRLAQELAALTGWRRYGLGFLLGVLLAGALPPVDLTPLVLVAFPGLLWLDEGSAGAWASARLGYAFGLGFFAAGLYWIAAALFVDIARFWWAVPFAVLGLPALSGAVFRRGARR